MKILQTVFLILVVGVVSGCNTAKGLGRDIKDGSATAGHKLQEWDAWMQEHMW